MVKNHLKRLNAPKSWRIKRKSMTFITKMSPGPHKLNSSMPLNVIFRDLLEYANTTREVRNILHNKSVLVNGKRRKEINFPIGLFDVIEIPDIKEYFRVVLDKKGKIEVIKIDKTDAEIIPCKITSKNKVKGKTQLNLFDGSNMVIDKDDYKVGDTLVISIAKKDIKDNIKLDKKALIYLVGGKHVSETGIIENIKDNKVTYKVGSGVFETLKKYVFVIGKDKPMIKLEK